ncbi:MAG: hypothetical protein OXU50_06440 [Gammaproteobacteria bacterium]|nr:hypothetical protein [Gammaproteobacteria bacterium]MDD9808162.1 hypothetical protein [Gammaproteobacteria bacterium]MDD9869514.1 hypothetical protein [Gammaproteobacteria bacterium]MDD9886971.1 hypothetical protein [Gammaproteobacteria bacterium]
MMTKTNRIFYAILAAVAVAVAAAYLAGGGFAWTAPAIGLNSPTTFPVDI